MIQDFLSWSIIIGILVWLGVGIQLFLLLRSLRRSIKRFWKKIGFRLELASEEFRKMVDDLEDMSSRGNKISIDAEYNLRKNGILKSIYKILT